MKRIVVALFLALAFGAPLGAEELTADMFDVSAAPKGVLSAKTTKAQWTAYQRTKECLKHPTYGEGSAYKLAILEVDAFKNLAPRALFPSGTGSGLCKPQGSAGNPPAPLVTVKLDERYGQQVAAATRVFRWIQRALAQRRYVSTPEFAEPLIQMLMSWAKANALGKGINVSWGSKPVDWQMMTLIAAILHAYIEVQPELTVEERVTIGPWLSGLVAKIAASRWTNRQDNKAGQTALVTGLWGLSVGDRKAVQRAIDVFKLGIHDMRPDGSQPIDTQRGGMGLLYNAVSTGNLFMIAAVLKRTIGVDLFDYAVDGRSIHTAVEFVVWTIQDFSRNKIYAISCPDGGDRWGSIEVPNTHFADAQDEFNAGYLLAYADLFPEREASKWIKTRYASAYSSWKSMEPFGASPTCMLGVKG